jgi:integrase
MLWQICQAEFFPRNLRLRSSITRARYFQAIGRFAEFLGREATLDDFDDDTFARWLLWLAENEGLAERTANTMVGRLRTLWTFLAKRGRLSRWPTVQKLDEPEITPLAWSHEELQSLFGAAGRMPGKVGHVRSAVWWETLLAWYWNTGERLGATLAMEWPHIDLVRRVAVLPAGIRKGRRKAATYHLWPEVVAMLQRLQRPSGAVFYWDRHLCTYFLHWNQLLEDAGLPGGRKRKSQAMRVSHATWLAFAGGDATRSLMHSDPATTRKFYLDNRFMPDQGIKLFRPWEPPEPMP